MLNVLADLHHGDLYHSLRMLFEQRLGGNLFRPIGIDWYTKGFWKYNDNLPTVKQYLQFRGNEINKGTHWLCPEGPHNETDKALTFEQFKKHEIDIVVGSVFQHEAPYTKLVADFKPNAKFIRQAANIHDVIDINIVKNIMASCLLDRTPPGANVVTYHQEFNLNTYKYVPPYNSHNIKNFMNCVPDSRDFYLWPKYKSELSEFNWKMHGILGEDGIIGSAKEIAKAMQDSTFIWHVKFGGDGFGHVIHNAFACGRPIITRSSYYKNCLAEPLLEDGVTCIDLDKHSFDESVKLIRHFSQFENLRKMCDSVYSRFCEYVDFNKEEPYLRKFLDNLI